DAKGQFCLALCYENGHGIMRNDTSAFRWYRTSAAHNNAEAANVLLNSKWTKRLCEALAKTEAEPELNWLRLIIEAADFENGVREPARKGNADSQYILARLLELGVLQKTDAINQSDPPEDDHSLIWYVKSSLGGNKLAEN